MWQTFKKWKEEDSPQSRQKTVWSEKQGENQERQGHGGQGFQEENSQKFRMRGKYHKNQAESQLDLLEASGT